MTPKGTTLAINRDPKLLDRKAVLEVYAGIINRSISDELHQGLVHEIFEHADAQGRLLARAGNLIARSADTPRDHDERLAVLDEIRRAME